MSHRIGIALASIFAVAACGSPAPHATVPSPTGGTASTTAGTAAAASPAVAETPTPLDPQIRLTHLSNGLTVYVMHHEKPEQRAALWLAVNAGSVLEDDDQRGLAHFVEHMAFNGTKHFKKQAIVNYIENIGMRFGPDVNAYTSFDQTVYMLTVPTDNHDTLSTGLDILRDWAGDVSFEPVEVDKERGVVLEEWRLGRGPFARIRDKQWPVMFEGSKYAERLPIGLPEVIRGAPRDKLVRFYKDWYRPENMAVIAVGDFDASEIEKAIAAKFGDLTSPGTKRTRQPVPVPHDQPTAVSIVTDPEMPFSQVQVIDKMDHRPEATRSDYRRFIVEGLYHAMVNARFQQLALDPKAPFTAAGSWTSDLTRTCDGFTRFANAKQGRTAEALTALVREIARIEQHGFNQSELDRVREAQLAEAENSAAEWAKTPADSIADEMTRNFFEAEQMPGRPAELAINRAVLPTVTLAELNHLAAHWGGERGRVITLSGPAKAKLPDEAEVRRLFAQASKVEVGPWKDEPPKPLLAKLPAPGKVIKTTHDDGADATVWTLSNGIRVIVKPTTFQNDSIRIAGWNKGGSSLVGDVIHARFADQVVRAMGAGDLDPVELQKALAGKVARINVSIGELSEGVWGSTRPADLETAMQLLYLRLTAPRRDERAFASWKAEQMEWARNRRLLPEISFYEDMDAVRTKNHPRRRPTTPEMLDKVDLDKSLTVWRQRFAHLGGFTFAIVGNIDTATLKPLVERYLASLPSTGNKETWKNVGITYARGRIDKQIRKGSEPKSYVSMIFSAPDRWSRRSERDAEVLSMVLRIRLREVLREDMGGVYGVRSWVSVSREPTERRHASISFGCAPDNVGKLRKAALGVLHDIEKRGITDEYLTKVKEQIRREHETNRKENWWWMNQLREAYWYGDDFKTVSDVDATIARATSANVKIAARHFFDERNLVTGVLRPAKTTKPATVKITPKKRPIRDLVQPIKIEKK